jgi:hypothetical protein
LSAAPFSQATVCHVKFTYIPYHDITAGYSSPHAAASPSMLGCYRRLQFAMCSCLTFHIMMSSQAAVCPVKLTYIPYHDITIGYSSPRAAASPSILGRHRSLQFAMCNCLTFHIMTSPQAVVCQCNCLTTGYSLPCAATSLSIS